MISLIFVTSLASLAESGILVVHVKDVQEHPIAGLQIGVKGDGGSATTGDDGKARIQLAKQTKENDWVSLQILHSPPGKDFMMVSPWDYGMFVPSFDNESKNVVEIVAVQRGDRLALVSGTLVKSLAAQINKANAPKTADIQAPPQDPRANLAAVAKQYGLTPAEVDHAIRDWGAKVTDPYEAGLAALYERNYSKASAHLADSLQQREKELAEAPERVADAACFLGASQFAEGKYKDSVTAYRRCLQLRPNEGSISNNLALSLDQAGYYGEAESIYRELLTTNEQMFGTNSPAVSAVLTNLGALLQEQGNYRAAEDLYSRALAIDRNTHDELGEAVDLDSLGGALKDAGDYSAAEPFLRQALKVREHLLGPDDPAVATTLNNLAELLRLSGKFEAAEPLYRRALSINEATFGMEHPWVARNMSNLGILLEETGRPDAAEPLYRQALEIRQKTLGPDHPDVATSLNCLGALLQAEGKLAEAEVILRQALTIQERALGPKNQRVAAILSNLCVLLKTRQDYATAEPICRQALDSNEAALGPDHSEVAKSLNNLALLLQARGDIAGAEPLFRKALAIDEKALGPEHLEVGLLSRNLATLLISRGNLADAEPLYRKALVIEEKTLGHDNADVAMILYHLSWVLVERGSYSEAKPLCWRALAIKENEPTPNHPLIEQIRNNCNFLDQVTAPKMPER